MHQSEDVEKLVADEDFQAFCTGNKSTDSSKHQFWKNEYSKGNKNIIEAKKLVDQLSLHLREDEVSTEFTKFKLVAYRQDAEKRAYSMRLASLRVRRWVAGIAAVVLALLFAGWFVLGSVDYQEYKTSAREVKPILLPDGSQVKLNANSSLKFAKNWAADQDREVWLHGEAFFSVSDAPSTGQEKFLVHTDKGDIIVLGTDFNVNEHQERFEVVLIEGKVSIKTSKASLKIIPGERAWLNTNGELKLEKVDIEPYVAWKNGRLLFREMPISRVVNRLYDDFGIVLNVPDNELLKKQVSANMNSGDPYALVEALAALYHLNLNASKDSLELTLTD